MKNKPSKMSQEIKKIIHKRNSTPQLDAAQCIEASTEVYLVKQLRTLCSTAIKNILGGEEKQHPSGMDRNKIITRNEHLEEQVERKARWFK